MTKLHRAIDATGRRIKVGDMVRILGVPDLSGMKPGPRAESLPVFEHLVGQYKRVQEFDEYGFAWFFFRIRNDPNTRYHSVAIEPYLLRVKRTRGRKPAEPKC